MKNETRFPATFKIGDENIERVENLPTWTASSRHGSTNLNGCQQKNCMNHVNKKACENGDGWGIYCDDKVCRKTLEWNPQGKKRPGRSNLPTYNNE